MDDRNAVQAINSPSVFLFCDVDLLVSGIKVVCNQVNLSKCIVISHSCNIYSHILASIALASNEVRVWSNGTTNIICCLLLNEVLFLVLKKITILFPLK